MVIQDMLRVFIVRIACQRVEHASILLRPIFASIREGILDHSSTRETEAYKVVALPLYLSMYCLLFLKNLVLSFRSTDILIFWLVY